MMWVKRVAPRPAPPFLVRRTMGTDRFSYPSKASLQPGGWRSRFERIYGIFLYNPYFEEPRTSNPRPQVRLWLDSEVRAMPQARLLIPQQATFAGRCRLSTRLLPLSPQLRTWAAPPANVSS